MTAGESPSELADRLGAEHPDWTISAHPLGLGLWSAEKRPRTAGQSTTS